MADLTGTYGFVVEDLTQGRRLAYNEQRVFPSASVYKLPVAVETLRRVDAGQLRLDDTVEVTEADAEEVEPDQGLAPGDVVTLGEALRVMLEYSSNAAGHALLRTLGRPQLNAALTSLGLTATHVPLLVGDSPQETDDATASGTAMTSPADMASLLRQVAAGDLLSEPSRAWLYGLLAYREDYDGLAEGLPDDVPVLSKAGTLDDASNVAGLLLTEHGPVIVSVFDEQADPGEARGFIGNLGRRVLELYSASESEI
jgi:beta-lactamase class A